MANPSLCNYTLSGHGTTVNLAGELKRRQRVSDLNKKQSPIQNANTGCPCVCAWSCANNYPGSRVCTVSARWHGCCDYCRVGMVQGLRLRQPRGPKQKRQAGREKHALQVMRWNSLRADLGHGLPSTSLSGEPCRSPSSEKWEESESSDADLSCSRRSSLEKRRAV